MFSTSDGGSIARLGGLALACAAALALAACTPGAVIVGGGGSAALPPVGGPAPAPAPGGAGKGATTGGAVLPPRAPLPAPLPPPTRAPVTASLNLNAPPSFGTFNLAANFAPDPFIVPVVAGGADDAGLLIGGACVGRVDGRAPDVNLNYSAGVFPLSFAVDSPVDTTLVINTPDGRWVCNDDFQGFTPAVVISRPLSGTYNIWIGTFGGTVGADLYITEQ